MKNLLMVLLFFSLNKFSQAQLSYTINFLNGNSAITCANPVVTMFMTGNTPGPVSYTWTNPQLGTSTGSAVSVSVPGTYTVTINSGTNTVSVPIAVLSNTYQPGLSVTSLNNTLSCAVPSLQLQASSPTPTVSYMWSGPQGSVSASNLTVNANYTIPPATTPLGLYTITVTDPTNGCMSRSIVPVYQNTFPPNAVIAATYSALTCQIPTVNLTNNSNSTIPPFFPGFQSVVGILWEGLLSLPNSSTYTVSIAGTYTLTAKDLNNGCTAKTTINILDNRVYPVFSFPPTNYSIACPSGIVTLNAAANGPVIYSWLSPPGAITSTNTPGGLTTNSQGNYTVTATNIQTGCSSVAWVVVYGCVGLKENNGFDGLLELFPNPAQDQLGFNTNLQFKTNPALSLHNTLGQLVFSQNDFNLSGTLDITYLKAGIYYLSVESDDASKMFKLVKE